MRSLILFLSVLSPGMVISASAKQAQQNAPAAQPPANARSLPEARRSSSSHSIVLDVVVTDKSGTPVAGLQEQDFSLLDDKVPRKIVSFHPSEQTGDTSDPSVQAILLVDTVNCSAQSVMREVQQLQQFLRRDQGRLPIPTSLVIFTDTSTHIQPEPTIDGNAVADTLGANQPWLRAPLRPFPQDLYGAGELFQLSLQTLEQIMEYEAKREGRKLLIWVSPGWPLLSGVDEFTSRDQRILFDNVVQFSQGLRDARIALYSVDPLGTGDAGYLRSFEYESFLKSVTSANKVEYGDVALQVLATQSGGLVLNSSNDLQKLIATTLTDAKTYYTLSFDAPPADHPDEYHSLEVKVNKPGLTARTRTGYYAQPYIAGGQ